MTESKQKPSGTFVELREGDPNSWKGYLQGYIALPDRRTITVRKAGFARIERARTPKTPAPGEQ